MFFDLILQAAPTVIPAGADPNITAMGAIIVGLGSVVGTVIGFLKSKEGINLSGSIANAALRKGTESKAELLKILTSDEDVKKTLVKQLTESVMVGVKQEETLVAKHPAMDPNKLQIPRERFDTKPAI